MGGSGRKEIRIYYMNFQLKKASCCFCLLVLDFSFKDDSVLHRKEGLTTLRENGKSKSSLAIS